MAINKNLLLPSAASSSAIVAKTIKTSALSSVKSFKSDVSNLKDNKSSLRDLLVSINEKVIKIDKILKKTTKLQNKDYQRKLRDQRTERNQERERKLEEKKKEDKKQKPDEKKLPGLGFLDRIKRFLFFTFLGWLTNKYWDKIPAILEFTKKLTPIIGVIETIGGAIFNGVVNFIDTGYKVYDGLRDFTKQIGGEDFQKKFDDFSKNLNTFINIAIIAGMATMGGTDFGIGGKPRGGRRNGLYGKRKGKFGVSPVETDRGINFRRDRTTGETRGSGDVLSERRIDKLRKAEKLTFDGKSATDMAYQQRKGKIDVMKKYADKYGRDAAVRRFGERGVKSLGGKYARSQFSNLARKGIVNTLGKGGTKAALKVIRPLVKRLPFIGAFVDFALSVALGEPLGRAAFKSIGAGLLGAIGTGFGGPLGAIIGGFAGDWAGGKLYDIFFGGQQNVDDKSKPKKKARGGVTRGGKEVSGNIGRTLKVKRTLRKTLVPPKPTKITPGIDIGGEDKIKSMFPEPSLQQSGVYQSPFGFLYDSTNSMGDIPYIGPLFSVFGKLILGQTPKSSDYKIISLGLTSWITNAITRNLLNGNSVDKMLKDFPLWVEFSIKNLITGVANKVISELKEYLLLKPLREVFSGSSLPPGELGDASDLVGGAKLLMDAGFPERGAAYLAGNIQQESGWNGQREPWVLNDGAGTNKGLVSWNRGRILNAEKFLGKSLNEASNGEQIRWIMHEMKTSYPDAYKVFMDPNATDAQLETASYWYLGYGDVGKRFKYAKEALKRLKAGETGTYKAGVDIKLGTNPDAALGSKLAGELGDFMKQWGKVPGQVHRHPKHGPWQPESGHSPGSLHYRSRGARAIDLGAYANEQGPILKKIEEFNRLKGVKPVQLLHAGNDPSGRHDNHVHVAYKDGGVVGPNKPKNIKPIESQASYDDGYTILIQPVIIEKPVPVGKKTINFSGGGSVNTNNDKSSLFIR